MPFYSETRERRFQAVFSLAACLVQNYETANHVFIAVAISLAIESAETASIGVRGERHRSSSASFGVMPHRAAHFYTCPTWIKIGTDCVEV